MSLTPKALIAQVSIGKLSIEGFRTKILVRYPIAIDFKEGLYQYRWVGRNAPDFAFEGYSKPNADVISIGHCGVFKVSYMSVASPIQGGDVFVKYSDPVNVKSSQWSRGLFQIIAAFEYDSDWYDLVEKTFDSESTLYERACLANTFWYSPSIPRNNTSRSHVKKKSGDPRKIRSTNGFMYAVQLDGFLKVGFSTNVESRINSYKTSSRVVELICVEPATLKKELAYHKKHNNGSEKYDTNLRDSIHDSIKSHLKLS
jgi:hypothetical protein